MGCTSPLALSCASSLNFSSSVAFAQQGQNHKDLDFICQHEAATPAHLSRESKTEVVREISSSDGAVFFLNIMSRLNAVASRAKSSLKFTRPQGAWCSVSSRCTFRMGLPGVALQHQNRCTAEARRFAFLDSYQSWSWSRKNQRRQLRLDDGRHARPG